MNSIRSSGLVSRVVRRTLNPRPTFSAARFYAQGYGDGKGDPKGENPQSQGANPSEHKEHPGPPPPAEGHGSGGATTAKGSKDSSSKSRSGGDPQPKIHDERNGPRAGGQSVEEHNREMKSRHGKEAFDTGDEKVDKKFWKG